MRSKLLTLFMAAAVVVVLATELSLTALAYQGNANKAAPAKPRAKKRKKPAAHVAAIPMTPQDCLNRLATLAAREPLPAYEGEPMKILNEGLLWSTGKCAVTDQAQRLKLADLANKWRMKDAAGVRSGLQDLGATASAESSMTPRPRRSPRRRATSAPATGETQAAPPTTEAPAAGAASNSNMRRPRPRRPMRRNSNTANTNS